MPYKNKKKRKEYHKVYDKTYYAKNKDRLKCKTTENARKRMYGIDPIAYKNLLDKQKGGCAICGRPQDSFSRAFHVDHCHETNKVRGLLCVNCNTMLGQARDDVDILLKAVKYLMPD